MIFHLSKLTPMMRNKRVSRWLQSLFLTNTIYFSEAISQHIPRQLEYSCLYFPAHLLLADIQDDNLYNLTEVWLRKHLLHWLEVLALLKLSRSALSSLRMIYKWLDVRRSFNYHLSALINRLYFRNVLLVLASILKPNHLSLMRLASY